MKKIIVACIAALVLPLAMAEPALYETGPSQDSSFVRFLNASDDSVSITSSESKAKISLTTKGDARATPFFPVKAGAKLVANAQIGNKKFPVEVVAKPGEFITVVLTGSASDLISKLLRDTPTDYSAMRSSVALLNLDEKCSAASLSGGAKNTSILDAVKPYSLQHRLINPVNLTVNIRCDGKDSALAVDMAQLQAGERYSVILFATKKGRQAIFVRDSTQ